MKKNILLLTILFSLVSAVSFAQSQPQLSKARKLAIDSLAMEKIRDLGKYISIVGDKETPWSEANRVIERTLELFSEGAEIGVSSLSKKQIKNYTIREYLERLMALNYDKVKIEWFDIQYISDLERQPDGRYVGVITIYQKFEGRTEEGLVYKDVTKKDITVYVERKETQIGGRVIGFWDVLLGDIRVAETARG